MRTTVPPGRVAYEPNSLDPAAPREDHKLGFATIPIHEEGETLRIRPESFADHYSQARLFWNSMTEPEQRHIVGGFAFELAKVKPIAIRQRMLGHLQVIDAGLADRVAEALGMSGQAEKIKPAQPAKDGKPSPALSQLGKAPKTVAGRKFGLLLTDGTNERIVSALNKAAKAADATVEIVAPRIGGALGKSEKSIEADHTIAGAPSALFDAVVLAPSAAGVRELVNLAAAVDWVRDAFAHLKVIGYVAEAAPLLDAAGISADADEGLVPVSGGSLDSFLAAAKLHRIWDREPQIRTP